MVNHFMKLLVRPAQGIRDLVEEKPSFRHIGIFLFFVGLLRGVIEAIWLLLMMGQFGQVITSFPLLSKLLSSAIPFVFANILTAYARWVMFSFLIHSVGVSLGGKGKYEDVLRVYGVILGIFLVTILPNFAYLFLSLPQIQFKVSSLYSPGLGIGQILTSVWLAVISSKVARIIHKLSSFESVCVGFLVPLLNIGLLTFGAKIFFNLSPITPLGRAETFLFATYGFIIVAIVVTILLLWLGFKLPQGRSAGNKCRTNPD